MKILSAIFRGSCHCRRLMLQPGQRKAEKYGVTASNSMLKGIKYFKTIIIV